MALWANLVLCRLVCLFLLLQLLPAESRGGIGGELRFRGLEQQVNEESANHSEKEKTPSSDLPFRNVSLPWSVRVVDLISRLNTSEIITQLIRGGAGVNGPAPAIPRLGIKPYNWNTECLRGMAGAGPATSFPQAIGLSAAFDPQLLWRVANATGAEVRAKHIQNSAAGKFGDHTGMSCFAPVINIMRHPLWGRNQETYGEDPFLTGEMSRAFVHGLQGNRSSRYLQASATCKHYDAYAGPENIPSTRFSFNAVVSPRDLEMTFLPAFAACTTAGARGVMCSYNSLNGQPACAHPRLLTDILRRRWKFPGYVISDEGALQYMLSFHHRYSDPTVAAAAAMNAGVDIELALPQMISGGVFAFLPAALKRRLVNETRLKAALTPLFDTRMRLGEFDPPEGNPYTKYRAADLVQSAAHRRLSLEAAVASFVLLKHRDAFLPWPRPSRGGEAWTPSDLRGLESLVLVGPLGRNMTQLYGDYAADRMPQFETTVQAGLQTIAKVGLQVDGCLDGTVCKKYDAASVRKAVAGARLIVLTLGTGQAVEAESNDRVSLALPNSQATLLADVISQSPADARILLLLFTASPVMIGPAVTSDKVKAILWCGLPAQTAGAAVAAALTSDGALAGRLPFTWYANEAQVPSMTNYSMENRTYRYLAPSVRPQFPFGFGMSLTEFHYDDLVVPPQLKSGDLMPVRVRVRNSGERPGQEVVQVYIRWPASEVDMPRQQLVGFRRTGMLVPGQSQLVDFNVTAEQRQVWRTSGFQPFVGNLTVFVGGQQPEQAVKLPSNVLKAVCEFV